MSQKFYQHIFFYQLRSLTNQLIKSFTQTVQAARAG